MLLKEPEWKQLRDAARSNGVTVADWVRQNLRAALRREPLGNVEKKLAAVRAAAQHSYPTSDIAQMLSEIESGYMGEPSR